MLSDDQSDRLFDGLVTMLRDEEWEGRFNRLLEEVELAISLGKPAAGEVSVDGKRKRERVRRVAPLDARERLLLLLRAIELALVVPVDLAASTLSSLQRDPRYSMVALAFEVDSATDVTENRGGISMDTQRSGGPSVRITREEVDGARIKIDPLREALDSIRDELPQ